MLKYDEESWKNLAGEVRIMNCISKSPALMHVIDGWHTSKDVTLVNNFYFGPTLKHILGNDTGPFTTDTMTIQTVKDYAR